MFLRLLSSFVYRDLPDPDWDHRACCLYLRFAARDFGWHWLRLHYLEVLLAFLFFICSYFLISSLSLLLLASSDYYFPSLKKCFSLHFFFCTNYIEQQSWKFLCILFPYFPLCFFFHIFFIYSFHSLYFIYLFQVSIIIIFSL